MNNTEFRRRVKALGLTSRTLPACRDVLVGGQTQYAAAKAHGVDESQLGKLCRRIREAEICEACGQPVS